MNKRALTPAEHDRIRERTDAFCTGVVLVLAIWIAFDHWQTVSDAFRSPKVWLLGSFGVLYGLWARVGQ